VKDAHIVAQVFGDRIEHLEQSLAMSSRMAAATGQAGWLKRYGDLETRLRAGPRAGPWGGPGGRTGSTSWR
jgi:hypothetical protein